MGLTTAQVSVLSVLARRGPSSHKHVAAELKIRPGAVTPMVTRLLAKGLVSRQREESDGRLWLLALTDRGTAVLEQAGAPFAEVNRVIDEALGAADIDRLADMLVRLSEAFDMHEATQPAGSSPAGAARSATRRRPPA